MPYLILQVLAGFVPCSTSLISLLTSDQDGGGPGGSIKLHLFIHVKQLLVLLHHIQRHQGVPLQHLSLRLHEALQRGQGRSALLHLTKTLIHKYAQSTQKIIMMHKQNT